VDRVASAAVRTECASTSGFNPGSVHSKAIVGGASRPNIIEECAMSLRQVSGFTAAVLLGAALLSPARASAQATTVGVKGGWNNSNVNLDFPDATDVPTDSFNGLIIGGFVGRDFNAKAGMLVDFLYARTGTNVDFSGINRHVKVDYIQIPVLGRTNFKASNAAVVHVFGGPTFAFKTSQSETLTVDGVDTPVAEEDEASLKGNDIGITIGAGFTINRFLVDVRYTWGLLNLNNDTGVGEPEVKSRQFAVMFGMELWRK
jgi:hypothetical protein